MKMPGTSLAESENRDYRSLRNEYRGMRENYSGADKMDTAYSKRINFTYKTKKIMEPAIVPYS